MEVYEALNAHLLAQSALTALIGNRIYPDEADEGTPLPYVVYINVSDIKDHIYGGCQELESPMYQWTVYAATKLQASAVAKQIKAAFLGRESEINGLAVQYIKLLNELSTQYTSPDRHIGPGGTIKMNTHDLEFEVNFERS